MNKILAGLVAGLFSVGMAYAQAPAQPAATTTAAPAASNCEAKALSKTGKPLTGAAKAAFIKKCEGGASAKAPSSCADKAVGKNGKPLAGAAKTAFMKKCEADAK